MSENYYPAKYTIHTKKSAMQVGVIPPEWTSDGPGKHKVTRAGAVFVESAPLKGENANGDNIYDWGAKKISIALGLNDINTIVEGIMLGKEKFELFHQGKDYVKKMVFQAGTGNYAGTFLINFSIKGPTPETTFSHSCSMRFGEAHIFKTLLESSVPYILGWPL